jgi:crotonobetainyl-CoA:carnitine CoA-transferase CaiB-like acyl-CoA transferase
VLDLSRVLAGPWCAQVLADLGADVIKVERPNHGDDTRSWGPPFVCAADGSPTPESAYFWACNRGKRSIAIDFSTETGRDVVARLAATSDILIENYKTGALQRYGLDYDKLTATNPRLIYCSITGFGQTGPYRMRSGYDTIIQAMGGLMSVTGHPDGAPGGGPLKVGVAVTDLMTALYSAVAILAALNERHTSGLGQHIDMSLLDVQVASLANIGMNFLASHKLPERIGNRLPSVAPSDVFRCLDGDLMLIVGNDGQFRNLCEAVGLSGLADDARFATNASRLEHADELSQLLAPVLAGQSMSRWLEKFEHAHVPASPINTLDRVFTDPQVLARKMVMKLHHPSAGLVPAIANPIRMSRTPPAYRRPPPGLGEHSLEVLQEVLGLSAQECGEFMRKGIL